MRGARVPGANAPAAVPRSLLARRVWWRDDDDQAAGQQQLRVRADRRRSAPVRCAPARLPRQRGDPDALRLRCKRASDHSARRYTARRVVRGDLHRCASCDHRRPLRDRAGPQTGRPANRGGPLRCGRDGPLAENDDADGAFPELRPSSIDRGRWIRRPRAHVPSRRELLRLAHRSGGVHALPRGDHAS